MYGRKKSNINTRQLFSTERTRYFKIINILGNGNFVGLSKCFGSLFGKATHNEWLERLLVLDVNQA